MTYYKLKQKERENFFLSNNYNLKKFWKFWSRGNINIMEVRIRDIDFKKELMPFACKNKLPFSASGVYVSNYDELLFVIKSFRDYFDIWFGLNPKKKSFKINTKYPAKYKTYNGTDNSIESISFLFIDIDRFKQEEPSATNSELEKSFKFVYDELLPDLSKKGIDEYMAIYSGNGIQVVIPLDEPLVMPELEFDMQKQLYEVNSEYDNLKKVVKFVFGEALCNKYNKAKYQNKYNNHIDISGFNIGRVCALPYTFNFKHDNKIMRGIIQIKYSDKDVPNKGWSDMFYNELDNINSSPVFNSEIKNDYKLHSSYKLKSDTLVNDKLVQFILKNDLPEGGRNNSVLFSLKCLIQDNNINFNASEVQHIKRMIENKWGRNCPFNPPAQNFHFNPEVVNNYCIEHFLPLLYKKVYVNKPKKYTFPEDSWDWDGTIIPLIDILDDNDNEKYYLSGNKLKNDILYIAKYAKPTKDKYDMVMFCKNLIKKYGKLKAKFIHKEYLPYYCVK